MKYQEETLKKITVFYMRRTGQYGSGNNMIMEKFKKWVKENNLLKENTFIFGIPRDSPMTTKPEDCRYDVCIKKVEGRLRQEEAVEQGEVEGGKYAVYRIKHTSSEIESIYNILFLSNEERGYEIDLKRPIIERYKANMLKYHYCEICLPKK